MNKACLLRTLSPDHGYEEKIKDYPQTEHTVLLFSHSDCVVFFISDLCKNFPIRIMQFLFARPYFHVFFKPVITVLSKKKVDQTAAAEWNISWVLALSSYCWITERCMVCGHAAFLLREDSSNPLGSLQTGLLSVPGDTKWTEKWCSVSVHRRKTGGVLQFSVCFREKQRKSFLWLISLCLSLCYLVLKVETNFKCMFLTITDASICQVFVCCVSSFARSYDRQKKLKLKKHVPHIKLSCLYSKKTNIFWHCCYLTRENKEEVAVIFSNNQNGPINTLADEWRAASRCDGAYSLRFLLTLLFVSVDACVQKCGSAIQQP